MKNLFCFHYPNKKEGKFIFQWAEMPHEQEGQAGETPRKPKKTREGKESPEQQMQRAFEKLEQSDIARELKQLCFFYLRFNNLGHEEFPDAFKNQLKKGKDGLLDAHSIPLWKAMELVAELFLKNNPEVEKKFNAMKISRPELMGAMFDEIFEFLEKFYGRVERDPHMLGAVQALKRRFYQLMYQKT